MLVYAKGKQEEKIIVFEVPRPVYFQFVYVAMFTMF